MDIFLIVIAFLFLVVGIVGSVLPVLPGPILSYLALVILYLTDSGIVVNQLIIWGVVVAVISILDYFIAPLITKKSGGSREAAIGSAVGVVVCLIFPISIFFGAFAGALIGELIHDSSDLNRALKVGVYSFLGFLTGTFMKLIVAFTMLFISIKSLI